MKVVVHFIAAKKYKEPGIFSQHFIPSKGNRSSICNAIFLNIQTVNNSTLSGHFRDITNCIFSLFLKQFSGITPTPYLSIQKPEEMENRLTVIVHLYEFMKEWIDELL